MSTLFCGVAHFGVPHFGTPHFGVPSRSGFLPNVDDPVRRGVEPRPPKLMSDLLQQYYPLAADQRPLVIETQENPSRLDQIRGLIETED